MKTRLSYFSDFVINEAKSSTKKEAVKVVLLSNVSEESKTVPSIKAECEKRGIKFAVINIDKANLIKNKDGETFTIYDNESKMKI
jgi:hypothetical protein